VIFDVDDTLYLERDYVRSGFREVGRWAQSALGVTDLGERAWTEFEAGRRGDVFDRVLDAAGMACSAELIATMVAVYRRHAPRIQLLPDAKSCLERLEGKVLMGAITDGPLLCQSAKVDALGLRSRFDVVIFTDQYGVGFGKPHPRAFEEVEATLGLSGPRCCYVADNPAKDFAGPARLGWRTVRIVRKQGLHASIPSGSDVQVEVSSLGVLPQVLGLEP